MLKSIERNGCTTIGTLLVSRRIGWPDRLWVALQLLSPEEWNAFWYLRLRDQESQLHWLVAHFDGSHQLCSGNLDRRVSDAFARGAREGWMRAVVFYRDIDAESDGAVMDEINLRWPIGGAS
jgi:hypothetical protein